ncbi:MAG: orotidine-5'-phosphate decarboxylase [Alphaproteobacteria bacterium]|nr:orotidine-5'-phosphate decarboxylase [Alphaproteobacteria bacterium]MBL7097006.1 orotidine-5'-phosphate decarboxylase [Alphaproteobacteria bacterium]
MTSQRFRNPVFVALDTPDLDKALELGRSLKDYVGGLKIGLEFITAHGPEGVRAVVAIGLPVFADVKFHDIPNTVAAASRELARLGATIFNIHVSGGEVMMREAVAGARAVDPRVMVVGVTVLTSIDNDILGAVGQRGPAAEQVVRLARLAKHAGLDGVVCSAQEIAAIRSACGPDFLLVTPGIRPAGAALADQRRVMTPAEAQRAGSDIMVIGRPITGAADPVAAARAIAAELGMTAPA